MTLNEEADAVASVALLNFYASDDDQKILHQRLTKDAKVEAAAGHCAFDFGIKAADPQDNVCYRVGLSAGMSVYAEAEADVDADGANQGRGSSVCFLPQRADHTADRQAVQKSLVICKSGRHQPAFSAPEQPEVEVVEALICKRGGNPQRNARFASSRFSALYPSGFFPSTKFNRTLALWIAKQRAPDTPRSRRWRSRLSL